MIRLYTREAGVRNLEREIAKLARKTVTRIVSDEASSVSVTPENIEDFLGVARFRFGEIEVADQVGVTTGLAWTEVGGELLQIEAVRVPGKGKVSATGKLGDVMKESIQAAEFFIKSRAQAYGIDLEDLAKHDIHVHVPEGATPKDGPSAGVAMATSIISAVTGIEVRRDVAMTKRSPYGGGFCRSVDLKEKLLAALRGGLKTVLIPKENEKDLADIPDNVKGGLEIVPVAMVDEVLSQALTRSHCQRRLHLIPRHVWQAQMKMLGLTISSPIEPKQIANLVSGLGFLPLSGAFFWPFSLFSVRLRTLHTTLFPGVLIMNKNDLVASVADA